MRILVRTLALLATAAAMSIPASGASATPPAAPNDTAAQQTCSDVYYSAENNPNVTGKHTVRSITTSRGTIQLRAGYRAGQRYGWARVLNGNPASGIVMKVDLNGDRIVDLSCGNGIWVNGVSEMYPTSPSSDRAFKACVRLDINAHLPCHPDHQTGWW